jgi:hypothetical protein
LSHLRWLTATHLHAAIRAFYIRISFPFLCFVGVSFIEFSFPATVAHLSCGEQDEEGAGFEV